MTAFLESFESFDVHLENLTKGPWSDGFKALNVTKLEMVLIRKVWAEIQHINLLLRDATNLAQRWGHGDIWTFTSRWSVIASRVIIIWSSEMFEKSDDFIMASFISPMKTSLFLILFIIKSSKIFVKLFDFNSVYVLKTLRVGSWHTLLKG